MTGLVVTRSTAQELNRKGDIIDVDLRELDGDIIKPIWCTRFMTKAGKVAHKILFVEEDDENVYSAFVNDKDFNLAIDHYLDEQGADKASIKGQDQVRFMVCAKEYKDRTWVYVNPID